jgi:hypothetical protein
MGCVLASTACFYGASLLFDKSHLQVTTSASIDLSIAYQDEGVRESRLTDGTNLGRGYRTDLEKCNHRLRLTEEIRIQNLKRPRFFQFSKVFRD